MKPIVTRSRVAKGIPHLAKAARDGSSPRQLEVLEDGNTSKRVQSTKDSAKSGYKRLLRNKALPTLQVSIVAMLAPGQLTLFADRSNSACEKSAIGIKKPMQPRLRSSKAEH